MKTKSLLVLIIILASTLLMVYQGDMFYPAKVSAMDSTKFEYNTGSIVCHDFATTTRWLSQTFTPEISHIIKSVKVRIKKVYPIKPYVYVRICPVEPTYNSPIAGEVLASGYYKFTSCQTYSGWLEIGLGDGTLLEAGNVYAIVIWTSDTQTSYFNWYRTANLYTSGGYWYSANSGTTWVSGAGADMLFEEWGILPPQEPQIFESYDNVAGTPIVIDEPFQSGQTFTVQERHILSKIFLNGYVPFELEAQFTVKLMATSGGLPTGEPIATASVPYDLLPLPGEVYWFSIDIAEEPELQAGVMYAIVVVHNASEGYAFRWNCDSGDEEGDYPGGTLVKSHNGGIDWSIYSHTDCCFQEWGYPLEQ